VPHAMAGRLRRGLPVVGGAEPATMQGLCRKN